MLKKPKPLRPGDCIGIVSPSSGRVRLDNINEAVWFLQDLGYKVCVPDNILDKRRYTKQDDKIRAETINEMFACPKIKAIFCARGGSRASNVIPYLNKNIIKKNPKIFIGYSDNTSLLLFFNKICNLIVFHGPMPEEEINDEMCAEKKRFMFSMLLRKPFLKMQWNHSRIIKKGKINGRLVGGCLTLIVESLGKEYEIDTRNKILFLEDLGESFVNIRFMLLKLIKAGKIDTIKGLIFGEMIKCGTLKRIDNASFFDNMIKRMFKKYKIPIITGFPSGHGYNKYTLPIGSHIIFDASNKYVQLGYDSIRAKRRIANGR